MRILFLSHRFFPDVGGIEVNSEVLASQFHKMGHRVTLVTWTAATGAKTFSFAIVRNPSLLKLISLHRKTDVVFENNPCLRLAWPSIFSNSISVVALRTWLARNDGTVAWQDKLKMSWINRAHAIIAVSRAVAPSNTDDVEVIGNPYRSDLFRITNSERDDLSFAFLGRLVSSKGCEIALKAFAMLFNKQKSTGARLPKLTIIGDGSLRSELEKQAKLLKVHHNVRFTGFLQGENLVSELNKNAYLLMPSLIIEAFGNVALEAMACGCLPIVSDTGGLPDAVGKAGVVVKNPNTENFYESISQVLQNPGWEKRMRKEALHHLKNHQPNVVAKAYMNVIVNSVNK